MPYEDKYKFDVIIAETGINKIRIIRWVRENTKLSLFESKELVENYQRQFYQRLVNMKQMMLNENLRLLELR